MSLREFRDMLLRVAHPEDILKLADRYLTQMQEMGDAFVLPKQYVVVKPVLEYYLNDLPGWVKFVKGVRDRLPSNGRQYHPGVQAVYRTLEIRLTQVQRRERLDAAVAMALRLKLIDADYDSKMRYSRRCTQAWKLRRDHMLKVAAQQTKTGRLTIAEREQLLDEFWTEVVAEIDRGEVPKP